MTNSHRLSIDITHEQKTKLDMVLDHGMRKIVFHLIINDLLELCETHGSGLVIGALVQKSIGVKELCKLKVGT